MYTLQAILLFLKLWPRWDAIFWWGVDIRQPLINGIDPAIVWNKPGTHLYSGFDAASWWIVLIPTYFILARAIMKYIVSRSAEK